MTTRRLTPDEARALVAGALTRARTSPANAASVAEALVAAELVGQAGHGLRRVAAYAAQARSGKVDGFATPTLSAPRPGALRVDAAAGFAYPALDLAFAPLCAAARTQGVAMAGLLHSHHCGVAGVVVERYARAGLVALMFANTPAAMAPWGASRPLMGTNPIAFAAPLDGAEPLVIDVALSQVARGKVMAAAQQGQPIPEGWALDVEGRPTTDAQAALAGTMAPLGGAKGTALALMVEVLAAGLTGANYASEASSFFAAEGPSPGVGQLILCLDPAAFGASAVARFTQLAAEVANAPGARLPGSHRHALRAKLAAEGIVADAALIATIEAIGRDSPD